MDANQISDGVQGGAENPVRLTVVIVNYRTWGYLDSLLPALLSSEDFEIVVVDNQSGDGRLADYTERYARVRFVLNSGNHGFAHGCNLGAANAAGETLLFLNPDVRAKPDDLLRLLEIKDGLPGVGILAPCQIDGHGRAQKVADVFPCALANLPLGRSLLRHRRSRSYPEAAGITQCDWITGSVMMIGRRDFEQLGGFDDHYWMYSEDVDLCHRMRERGSTVATTDDVVLTHCHAGASGLNEETRILTKTEVVISKHLFYSRRYAGSKALAAHVTEAVKRCVPTAAAIPLNLLTLGRVRGLRIRQAVLAEVFRHYRRWFKSGSPLSPQSVRSSDADPRV